jgi:hypothetical protein
MWVQIHNIEGVAGHDNSRGAICLYACQHQLEGSSSKLCNERKKVSGCQRHTSGTCHRPTETRKKTISVFSVVFINYIGSARGPHSFESVRLRVAAYSSG